MEQDSLFQIKEDIRPLADRMRPETLEEYVGQHQLVEKGKLLWQMIENDQVTSMIFWGPPGVGKQLWQELSHIRQKVILLIFPLSPVESRKSKKS